MGETQSHLSSIQDSFRKGHYRSPQHLAADIRHMFANYQTFFSEPNSQVRASYTILLLTPPYRMGQVDATSDVTSVEMWHSLKMISSSSGQMICFLHCRVTRSYMNCRGGSRRNTKRFPRVASLQRIPKMLGMRKYSLQLPDFITWQNTGFCAVQFSYNGHWAAVRGPCY